MDKELIKELVNNLLRVETIQHIPLCFGETNALNETVREELESDDSLNKFFPGVENYEGILDEYFYNDSDFSESPFFLVQFSTPCRGYFSTDSFNYSWGYTQLFWIKGDTIEDCYQEALIKLDAYISKWKAEKGIAA